MKTIGYVRVSTGEQGDSGLSIENQIEKISAYCKAYNLDLAETIVDVDSGKNLKRPGVQRLIQMCKSKECEAVVIYKLDRITRNQRDLHDLVYSVFIENGIQFKSMQESFDTSTAVGRMVLNLLGVIIQWEREAISERTKEALDVLKKQGRRAGEIPYGFDLNNGKLVPNRWEQSQLEYIARLRANGFSYKQISDKLNLQSIPPKKGRKWFPMSVMQICKRASKV